MEGSAWFDTIKEGRGLANCQVYWYCTYRRSGGGYYAQIAMRLILRGVSRYRR